MCVNFLVFFFKLKNNSIFKKINIQIIRIILKMIRTIIIDICMYQCRESGDCPTRTGENDFKSPSELTDPLPVSPPKTYIRDENL